MRREKGITLIALIITIIVMLILVGVVVQVVIQSDLLGTAKTTGDKYKTAYEDESNMSEVTINGKEYGSIEDYLDGPAPKLKYEINGLYIHLWLENSYYDLKLRRNRWWWYWFIFDWKGFGNVNGRVYTKTIKLWRINEVWYC